MLKSSQFARHFLWFGIALLSFCSSRSSAQGISEYQVKAAYLYDLAKLAQWPAEAVPHADSTLVLCVFGGEADFVSALRATVAGKTINTHPLSIKYLQSSTEARPCHLLFFRGPRSDTDAAISALDPAPILLVGQDPEFLSSGGMINLVLKDGRIAYEINPEALSRSHLRLNSAELASEHTVAIAPSIQTGEDRAVKSRVSPVYPAVARKLNLKGAVQLKATVRPDGTVKDVQILGGHPILANAAEQAVMKWRFAPAARETVETVKVSFEDY
jgi:TonB family protein